MPMEAILTNNDHQSIGVIATTLVTTISIVMIVIIMIITAITLSFQGQPEGPGAREVLGVPLQCALERCGLGAFSCILVGFGHG